jgi:hypothetical protein
MTAYAGLDTDIFPGLAVTAWWRANTNLSWLGYYLAPTPSHQDKGWMGQRAALVAQGWGLLPIFLGQELQGGPGSHDVVATQGMTDGQLAAQLMASEGFPAGSKVVLDLERPADWATVWAPYVTAWSYAVRAGGYAPDFYGSHVMAAQVRAGLLGDDISSVMGWAYKVAAVPSGPFTAPFSTEDPAALSGVGGVFACQYAQDATIADGTGKPRMVDLSTSLFADPGAP